MGRPSSYTEIYALVDPRDGRERYTGKATNSQDRLKRHFYDAERRNTPVYAWIRKLRRLGLKPEVKVLRVVRTCDWQEAERAEIARHRNDLFWRGGLLNLADGGDQPKVSAETLRANALLMRDKLRADPVKLRARRLKIALVKAFRRGWVNDATKAKLQAASLRHPAAFAWCAPYLS